MNTRLWVYKCNREEQPYARAIGDWDNLFRRKGVTKWGGSWCTTNPVSVHILNRLMQPNDLILAYQTNDRSLVGICRLIRMTGGPGERQLYLKPTHRFETPVPIHDLKATHPELNRVRAFSGGFPQMLYAVSDKEQKVLEGICGMKLTASAAEPVLPPKSYVVGAGFGSPESNRRIERAAIKAVTRWYQKRKWAVTSRESDRCGYDLFCKKGTVVECVEVKGVGGSTPSFIITASELSQAETNPAFLICVVTAATSGRPRIMRLTGKELREGFHFRPLQYHATPAKS